MNEYTINTKCVQAGYTPGNGEPRQIPIVQSTTFKYDTSEAMGRLFDLEDSGYFYTRLQKSDERSCGSKDCSIRRRNGRNVNLLRAGSQLLRTV